MADDQAFHEKMARAYAFQKTYEHCPMGEDPTDWKNRYHVQAKLARNEFIRFREYCQDNGYSINTALKQLLATHPDLTCFND